MTRRFNEHIDDPFSPEADPYLPQTHVPPAPGGRPPGACHCGRGENRFTRRQALFAMGVIAAAVPVHSMAGGRNTMVPCVQEQQQITACQHKFCKHFGGGEDFHGR